MAGFGFNNATSSPTTVQNWSPAQNQLANLLFQQAQSGLGQAPSAYPGQMYVGAQPGDIASYNNAFGPNQQIRQGAVNQALSGKLTPEQENLYNNPTMLNQYLNTSEAQQRMAFNRNVINPMSEKYAGNLYSSARVNEEGNARNDFATSLAAQRSAAEMANREQYGTAMEGALNRQVQGMGMASEEAGIEGNAATYARQIEQEKMLSGVQRWMMGETVNGVTPSQYNPYLQLVMGALGLSGTTVAQNQQSQGFNFGILER